MVQRESQGNTAPVIAKLVTTKKKQWYSVQFIIQCNFLTGSLQLLGEY